MSVYWIVEALPIGLTSLLPLVLFPAFGILPADKVAIGYFKVFHDLINKKCVSKV